LWTTTKENEMALTPGQRIKKIHIWLMNDPRFAFFSGVAMMGKSEITRQVPTAATNGRDKWYNPDFIAPLNEKQLRFLVLHENYHAGARHLSVYNELHKLDPMICNMALDQWINNGLQDSDPTWTDIEFIEGGCLDRKYKDWNVKKIFMDLRQQQKDGKGKGNGTGETTDQHDWDGAEDMTPKEAKELAEEIDQALRQGAILAGKLGASANRAVTEMLEAKIDWRTVLAEFVKDVMAGKDSTSWAKLNRRFVGQGVYLPASISESVGKLCIAIDTSGSIGQEMINIFAAELVSICREVMPDGVDLVWWDSNVCGVQEFGRDEFDGIDNKLTPVGGGGTTPQCVADWLEENKHGKHVAVVLLSDGYVNSWPQFPIPALWALTTKGITADNGQTVYIDE